jgi:hypothetical protein
MLRPVFSHDSATIFIQNLWNDSDVFASLGGLSAQWQGAGRLQLAGDARSVVYAAWPQQDCPTLAQDLFCFWCDV